MSKVEVPKVVPPPRPLRPITEYDGPIPTSPEGRYKIEWEIEELCGVMDNGRKCRLRLQVRRQKKTKFEWDELHTGGQLMWDDKDNKFYKFCRIHSPPEFPDKW